MAPNDPTDASHPSDPADPATPLAFAVDRIGDRWTLLIVDTLLDSPLKFGEIEAAVTGIAPTMLTKRLRQLESDGIVIGRPYTERPLRLAYELTGPGRSLAGAIQLLRDWGASHTGDEQSLMHDACGSALTIRWWCPSCDVPVDDDDATDNVRV